MEVNLTRISVEGKTCGEDESETCSGSILGPADLKKGLKEVLAPSFLPSRFSVLPVGKHVAMDRFYYHGFRSLLYLIRDHYLLISIRNIIG